MPPAIAGSLSPLLWRLGTESCKFPSRPAFIYRLFDYSDSRRRHEKHCPARERIRAFRHVICLFLAGYVVCDFGPRGLCRAARQQRAWSSLEKDCEEDDASIRFGRRTKELFSSIGRRAKAPGGASAIRS